MKKNQKLTVWQAEQVVLRVDARVKTAMRKAAAKADQSMNSWAEAVLAKAAGVNMTKGGTR